MFAFIYGINFIGILINKLQVSLVPNAALVFS